MSDETSDEKIVVEIKDCRKCGAFSKREFHHFLLEPDFGWIFTCNDLHRDITPEDGVNPPPVWCPLRPSNMGEKTPLEMA